MAEDVLEINGIHTVLSKNHFIHQDIDGLVQDYSNSIANALELLQSCTEPLIYAHASKFVVFSCGLVLIIFFLLTWFNFNPSMHN